MNKEEKIYFLKNIPLGKKTIFRDLEIVLRKTDWWSSRKSFAIWCARYRDWETDRKSTRLNSSHSAKSRMPSSA